MVSIPAACIYLPPRDRVPCASAPDRRANPPRLQLTAAFSDIALEVISLLEALVDAWKIQATAPDPGYGPSAPGFARLGRCSSASLSVLAGPHLLLKYCIS